MTVAAPHLFGIAQEFADLHGDLAVEIARRAYRMSDQEGDGEGAQFWFVMTILVSDVLDHGPLPYGSPSIH